MKRRSGDKPNNNYKYSTTKRPGASEHDGCTLRETSEGVPGDAKKIAFLFLSRRFLCAGMTRHVI
jgi:hypothetical protein